MSEKYSYGYSVPEKKEAEEIRKKYEQKTETPSTLEQIKKLDKDVTRRGSIASLIIGIIGTLVLGVGMCCVTVWSDRLFALGIITGIMGIVILSVAYPVYKHITEKERKKITPLILDMIDEILKK